MFIHLKKHKTAQSTLEYAILISIVVAALLVMRTYLKRGYQGNLRGSADRLGTQFAPGTKSDATVVTYTRTSEKAAPSFLGDLAGDNIPQSGSSAFIHTRQKGSEEGVATDGTNGQTDYWPEGMDAGAGLGE